ncbi:MAG: fused MFS/spermidine synthase [Gammaproteobacteria bacterium]
MAKTKESEAADPATGGQWSNEVSGQAASSNGRDSTGVLIGVVACFVLSGFAALLYQTAWLRQFSLVFGTSELAVATVLAAYMGGLAIGAMVAGRVVERVRRPILVYGVLEAGVALTALAVPVLLAGAYALYGWVLGDQLNPPQAATIGQPVFYLIVAFLVLALPTGFMGATLPMLIRHVVQRNEEVGSRVALLYATNTAGAVAGTVVAGFILLPALGLKATVWVGVLVNGVVFVIAAWLAKRAPTVETPESGERTPILTGFIESCVTPLVRSHGRSNAEGLRAVFREQPAWILPLILISGANAFFYEVLWTRMLAHVLGGSIYAFATMLAAFLTGIALGGGLAGKVATDRSRAAYGFAFTQVAIAVLSMAVYEWMGPLIPEQRGMGHLAVYGVMVMLPATIFIGATFPLAVRLLARDEREASTSTARIYTWNTVGAVVGAILAGFYLIPTLGFEGSIKLAVLINLIMALWTVAFVVPPKLVYTGAMASTLLLVGFIYQPNRPQAVINNTAFELDYIADPEEVFFAVGRSSTVIMLEEMGYFHLRTNGLPEANIGAKGTAPWQDPEKWLTALPVVARPDTENMLVIGFGGGVALEGVPASVQEVDVIELEPEVVNANRKLAGRRSKDPLEDPRINVIFNDARNALRLTSKHYDVIVSQPSHPWTAGASHLFTREFVHLAKQHLTEDGVFVQWINSEFVDEPLLRSLAATVLEEFEYVRLYQPNMQVLMFLGSDQELEPELRLAKTGRPVTDDVMHFSRMGINAVEDLVVALTADQTGLEKFASGAPVSTDNNNLMATRSRSLADGLYLPELLEVMAPYDPLRRPGNWIYSQLGDDLNFGYIAQRLLNQNQAQRAGAMAEILPNRSTKFLVHALIYLSQAQLNEANQAMRTAFIADPTNMQARYLLIHDHLDLVGQSNASDELLSIVDGLRGGVAAVVKGWQYSRDQDWQSLYALDSEMNRSRITDLWYTNAARLRAEWRTRISPDEERFSAEQFNALRLVDRALVIAPDRTLHLLRLASAVGIKDGDILIESARVIASSVEDELESSYRIGYRLNNQQLQSMGKNLQFIASLLEGILVEHAPNRAGQIHEEVNELLRHIDAYGVTIN